MNAGPHTQLEAVSLLEPDAAYWAVDADQRITYWSPGAARMLGYTAEDVVGKHCSAAVNCVRCATGCGLQARGRIEAKALPHYHKDGHEVPALKWAQATFDAEGRYTGGVEVLRAAPPDAPSGAATPIDFFGILTGDARFAALLTGLRHVAHTQVNVLLRGETGTGKDLVARALHAMSPRAGKPFTAVNCGTLSREFLISEIFGHKRGAFTGAVADKQGLLAVANGGTLFLDEVAELPLDVQAMLLRVLQERRYTPLGDTRDRPTDIRLISATHESLREAAAQGRFREDLLFRLRVVPVFLPPLRERGGDVLLLLDRFLQAAAERMQQPLPQPTAATRRLLAAYRWPGNVRELLNLADYLVVTRPGASVAPEHLLPEFLEPAPTPSAPGEPAPPPAESATEGAADTDSAAVDGTAPARIGFTLDRAVVAEALRRAGGRTDVAAQALGVSRVTLWRWRKKLELP